MKSVIVVGTEAELPLAEYLESQGMGVDLVESLPAFLDGVDVVVGDVLNPAFGDIAAAASWIREARIAGVYVAMINLNSNPSLRAGVGRMDDCAVDPYSCGALGYLPNLKPETVWNFVKNP